jgi:hypothetical protein
MENKGKGQWGLKILATVEKSLCPFHSFITKRPIPGSSVSFLHANTDTRADNVPAPASLLTSTFAAAPVRAQAARRTHALSQVYLLVFTDFVSLVVSSARMLLWLASAFSLTVVAARGILLYGRGAPTGCASFCFLTPLLVLAPFFLFVVVVI